MDYQWQTDVFTAFSPAHEALGKITYQDMPATPHPTYLITQVWVDPAHRGQGIAGQLTTAFLTEVRQRTGYVIPGVHTQKLLSLNIQNFKISLLNKKGALAWN